MTGHIRKNSSAEENRQHSEHLVELLLKLGQKMNAADSREKAATIISEVADEMFGWDACAVDLYSDDQTSIYNIINVDTVDGKRVSFPAAHNATLSSTAKKVLRGEAEIILRKGPLTFSGTAPYGDKSHPSASLLFVPIRVGDHVIGVFSIQSYSYDAYKEEDLVALQALADHCAGALERIRTTEALRQREERFRTLTEAAPIGIFETDEKGLFTYANVYWQMISGLAPNETLGNGWQKVLHPEDRDVVLEAWNKIVTEGREWSREFRLQTPLGSVHWVRVRVHPVFDRSGDLSSYLGTVDDITDNKIAEKLRDSLRQLGQTR